MLKLAHSFATLALLSGALIAAHSQARAGSDAGDALQSERLVYAPGDATDADQSRNSGQVHGKLLQVVGGSGRITAWLRDSEGKDRMLMLADMAPNLTALSLASESGSVFGYLYAAGQPDPHKTKSNVIVIGSYTKVGNSGSFDLVIYDRRQMQQTSHVQLLGRVQGQFGQDGSLSLLTQSPQSDDGRAFIDPIDAGPLARDSSDGREGGVQVTKPAASDGSGPFIDPIDAAGSSASDSSDGRKRGVQVAQPAEQLIFAASVSGRWELN